LQTPLNRRERATIVTPGDSVGEFRQEIRQLVLVQREGRVVGDDVVKPGRLAARGLHRQDRPKAVAEQPM
jgi:hypothetical protein